VAFHARFVLSGVSRALGANLPDKAISHLLLALTRINVDVMRALIATGRRLPPLYQAGVRYRREARGADGQRLEDWRDCVRVFQAKAGDCEDLAAYRAAELIVGGEQALTVFHSRPMGPGKRLFHIFVERANGVLEDPSRELGMGNAE
jgi:hypothetical protein